MNPYSGADAEQPADPGATFDGLAPLGYHTRRDCVLAGVLLFGVTTAALFVASEFSFVDAASEKPSYNIRFLLSALWIVMPVMGVLGGLIAYHVYADARARTQKQTMPWYYWLLYFLIFGWFVIFVYFQWRRRASILGGRTKPGWKFPAFYAGLYALIFLICMLAGEKKLSYVAGVLFSALIGECVLVNVIATWRNRGVLLPPPSHRFQFSLGALIAASLALGLYGSGLFLICQQALR